MNNNSHKWLSRTTTGGFTSKCSDCGYIIHQAQNHDILKLKEFWADFDWLYIYIGIIEDPNHIIVQYAPEYKSCDDVIMLRVLKILTE